ncbi:hypothetical protein HKBW3S42_00186 [Candidatus Hakubella thermalkaliphila]|uniref:Uncharacterized protein n=1 Tax=Candidatus Hakubella thermalkaliphila TaxID=2754717 RepID=A0A6V8QEA1_9ACTN|nr:hypothetical protein HKBW3S42_00186 [Candidatus Hakubella thermalkaliphila]GFP42384.1 hypothetical protein HKBW3C_01510 [Candidatus Hakubella thermalkaliphila]
MGEVRKGRLPNSVTIDVEAYTCGNNPYAEWSGTVKLLHKADLLQSGNLRI